MIRFAVHYSPQMVTLLNARQVKFDTFKCPAWPDLVAQAQSVRPAYIHYPLRVGAGIGHMIDSETRQPAIWDKIDSLRAHTSTPFINVHLSPLTNDHPDLSPTTLSARAIERVKSAMLRDLEPALLRYGPKNIILENNPATDPAHLRAALRPEVIRQMVEITGCGFLLDIAHAQLSAPIFKMTVRDYLDVLPVESIREIHVSGVQVFDKTWIDTVRPHLPPRSPFLTQVSGQWSDHLPMTETDWDLLDFALEQIHRRRWGKPWAIAFEYSGVGALWQATTRTDVLREQVPRLYAAIHRRVKV